MKKYVIIVIIMFLITGITTIGIKLQTNHKNKIQERIKILSCKQLEEYIASNKQTWTRDVCFIELQQRNVRHEQEIKEKIKKEQITKRKQEINKLHNILLNKSKVTQSLNNRTMWRPGQLKDNNRTIWEAGQLKDNNDRLEFEILRTWKPNGILNSYGADILIKQKTSKKKFIQLMRYMAKDYNPVTIKVWTSIIAYNDKKFVYPESLTDFILVYIKNTNNSGIFAGVHEIRWMQEKGQYANLFNTVTKLKNY